MSEKHVSWIVNVDGNQHIVYFDFSSGSFHGYITISVDENQVVNKKAARAHDFNGVYPIKVGSKIADLRVMAKALAIIRGFHVELGVDGKKIEPTPAKLDIKSASPNPNLSQSEVHITMLPERKRVPAVTEVVKVPPGVIIKVKRSRTIEHSVAVNWRASSSIELGIQQLLSASIRGEIERTSGRAYQQTETIEYEVELNGEKANRYKLIWTDLLIVGMTKVGDGKLIRLLPFEFPDHTELDVNPFETENDSQEL